ncbi:MAG TPA: hypothetical protein DCY13_01890 [Verrucomicrobiales bacterium]|nr:hypothetical protein [Verrucomicrobiales bacterium]
MRMLCEHAIESRSAFQRGSVLVIVLWVTLGLVTLAIYFAHSMSLELKGAQNRVSSVAAEHAIHGARRYLGHLFTNNATNGVVPNLTGELPEFRVQGVPVGDSHYWLVGRGDLQTRVDLPVFGLIDENGKLNLNTATAEMLEALPRMTPELAGAIIDWRDEDSDSGEDGGAEDETYARLNPPRRAKNAPFETVDELRLVYGMTTEVLFGEDANLNGVLDPNENDGDLTLPYDNQDGRLDSGLFEYVTVYSQVPGTRADGSARVNITNQQGRQQLRTILSEQFGDDRANEILAAAGPGNIPSVLQFFVASGMTADEFVLIHTDISASNDPQPGLVNVNTAGEAVLACIPGIGLDHAPALVAHRAANPAALTSMAWVKDVLDGQAIAQAGRFLTDQSYQLTADVVALGEHARGLRRTRFVFDTSDGTPKILFRRDLTSLGWPLGPEVRREIQLAMETLR